MRKTVANQVKNPRRSARSVEIPSLASGWQIFKYGKLGELTENIRTFALPFENQPYTFRMQYEYDSWNRIQKMTYPDGEEVYYEYNLGGMLEKMSGNKNGVQYTYIDSIAYNEFELKEVVWYGNGTRTRYEYDTLQRLKRLLSECADGVMQDLYYDYDDVSNITSIGNHAGMLPNGLGGNYSNRYRYDNLYRLVHSDGEWDGDRYLHYDMDMSYLKNGRLRHKRLDTETWIDGTPVTVNYDNNYSYDENQQPNTVRGIYGSHHHDMQWDAKGNLVRHRNHHAGYDRRLCWDEQNRLTGVADNSYLSLYQYDANGDRTYKLTGRIERQNVSGGWRYFYVMDKPTLYTSPYLVATRHGYTKHYYTENERVASRIGGGGLHGLTMTGRDDFQELLQPELPLHHPSCIPNEDEFRKKRDAVTKYATEVARCLDSEIRAYAPLESLAPFSDILIEEPDCYWYHTDHLGSSSWITYTDGHAVQHLHYLPFGENFVDQKSSSFDGVRYTFSAKERDTETGYSYFGSRYYSSDLSIWLSVDPMAHKYPSLSPFVYCANNPVKLVDPNGEEIGDYFDQYGKYLGTDCIDDGKIHIIDEKLWNGLYKDMFSYQMDNGTTYISSVIASDNPSCPNLFSQKPTNANLSDEAILNILQQYNTTGIELQINNEKGSLTTTFANDNEIFLTANVNDWKHSPFLNDYYEIYSSFDNENGHIEQHAELKHRLFSQLTKYERECYAVEYQKRQPVFKRTSSLYQRHVDKYLKSLAPRK